MCNILNKQYHGKVKLGEAQKFVSVLMLPNCYNSEDLSRHALCVNYLKLSNILFVEWQWYWNSFIWVLLMVRLQVTFMITIDKFLLCKGSHHVYHQINTFAVSKDKWDTREGTGKFMKNTLYNCGIPKGTSQAEVMEKPSLKL